MRHLILTRPYRPILAMLRERLASGYLRHEKVSRMALLTMELSELWE